MEKQYFAVTNLCRYCLRLADSRKETKEL